MDKYNNSILLAIVILYLVAWTRTLEDEISYDTDTTDIKSPWSVNMQLLANLMQSILLLVLGALILKVLNMIHFKWILDTPDSIDMAQLDEVFKSIVMVLKQSFFIFLAPFILSLIVTNTIDWIMRTFMGMGMPSITVVICNLIFTLCSFIF